MTQKQLRLGAFMRPVSIHTAAWRCNAMEENQGACAFAAHDLNFRVKPFEILTIRAAGIPVQDPRPESAADSNDGGSGD